MPIPSTINEAITSCIPDDTKEAVTAWFDKHTLTPKALAAIQNVKAGPTYRQLQATLLVHHTLGEQSDAVLADRAIPMKAFTVQDFAADMSSYAQFHKDAKAAKAGQIVLMPSFRFANTAEKQNAKDTISTAIPMLTKALLCAKYVVTQKGHASDQTTKWTQWFGAYSAPNATKVANNLKALCDTLADKPVRIYYRGPKMKGPNDKPSTKDAPGPLDAFASAFTAEQMKSHPEYDKAFNHLSLGIDFFARHKTIFENGAKKIETITSTKMKGWDQIAGVLIHELSHHVCTTKDEKNPDTKKETYGYPSCEALATKYPDLACNNADNLEYFCESFNQ